MNNKTREHWIQWYGFVPNESHDIMDMSDVTLQYDLMCRHCHKVDKELEVPCELNPNWQVII
jgi:hypothetical protein